MTRRYWPRKLAAFLSFFVLSLFFLMCVCVWQCDLPRIPSERIFERSVMLQFRDSYWRLP